MSRWKRLSRKRRAAYATAALFVLATAAWAVTAGSGSIGTTTMRTERAAILDAPLLPPDEVFIQKTSSFGDYGNVLVSVRLSAEQLARKGDEGTQGFVVIGNPEAPVILRDDGLGGDATASDGVFSGPAYIDDAQLASRGSADSAEFSSRTVKTTPRFVGRSAIGVHEPQPFDYDGFQKGVQVPLGPAVAFLEAEGVQGTASLITSKGAAANKISSAAPVVPGTNTFQDRVLMIRDIGVVTDPGRTYNPCANTGAAAGTWTFNHLMTQMANPAASGIDPSVFVQKWLENWLDTSLEINEDPVPARTQVQNIINLWPKTSGKLNLARSPLRLLSINPRVDLRRTTGGGGAYSNNASGNFLDAGEARFIFGFAVKIPVGQDPNQLFVAPVEIPPAGSRCFALPFTVILEYRIPKCDCKDVREWAKQWIALNDNANPPGSAVYNARLEAITQQFVLANSNPRNPNGSSLGQLRTNEVAVSNPFFNWELREFQLTQFPFTFLQETTTDDTPQNVWQNTSLLRDWILNIKPSLSGPDFEDPIAPVPLFFSGSTGVNQNFLAGKSQVIEPNGPFFISFFWNAPGLLLTDPQENWARHRVSRAACNGCHRRETFTSFVHVDPGSSIIQSTWDDSLTPPFWNPPGNPSLPPPLSNPSLPAELSLFLTGINNLGDPATASNPASPNLGTPTRNFDDLARREADIKKVANLTCFRFHPVNAALVKKTLKETGQLPVNLFDGISLVPVEQRVSVAVDDMTANHISEVH